MLPTTSPRVIVPLSSPRHTTATLGLHNPGRWIARVGVRLACTLAAFGSKFLLRGQVLLIATRKDGFVPLGAVQSGLTARYGKRFEAFALYLGTKDDNRKTVVLPMDDKPPSVILKFATTPTARYALGNEAAALSALSSSPVAALVPSLLDLISTDEALTLYQEYRPRRQIDHVTLDATVVAFLGQLTALSRKPVLLSDVLMGVPAEPSGSLPNDIQTARCSLLKRLHQLGDAYESVWVHRTHGDFAPWNCTWSDQGLFVFDWEESLEDGLALGDAFYYAIAPVLLLQSNPSARSTLHAALRFAARVAESYDAILDARVYLALWLLQRAEIANLYDELTLQLDRSWQSVKA